MTTIGAVILAGGRSSRMGTPKAWLDWRGTPLLSHILAVTREVCAARIAVVGADGDQVLPPLPAGVVRTNDPADTPRAGPLVGLLAGLQALARGEDPPEIAYLGACDSVHLSAAHLRFITGALLRDPGLEAAVPRDPPNDRGKRFAHPLASAVRVAPALAHVAAIVREGGRRPIFLFERLRTEFVDRGALPDARVLETCNTPEEYAAAVAAPTAGP